MVVVAVMPAAGLMISIGKSLPLIDPLISVSNNRRSSGGIGWAIIGIYIFLR